MASRWLLVNCCLVRAYAEGTQPHAVLSSFHHRLFFFPLKTKFPLFQRLGIARLGKAWQIERGKVRQRTLGLDYRILFTPSPAVSSRKELCGNGYSKASTAFVFRSLACRKRRTAQKRIAMSNYSSAISDAPPTESARERGSDFLSPSS